ncbi:maleylpyruvate isomerase N-terminal domain-containing protein [Nonomuraea sp. NPDC047529]|uniref:maleylpyruvate isomerase N-terminal domain-containing protein n=1 Tax=Nonomuraea sp. NPDC047529 TaxID=3155623 RepID=UPI0033E53EEE
MHHRVERGGGADPGVDGLALGLTAGGVVGRSLDRHPATWDAPTLCAGWRVREVAVHMSMGLPPGRLRGQASDR